MSLPATTGSKITKRQHYQQIAKSTKKPRAELVPLPFPEEFAHVWVWFCDVRHGEPLTCAELHAWTQLTEIEPEPFESHLIRKLDALYWKLYYGNRNGKADS